MMLPLLIFDLDGTLIDSKKDIADSLNYSLATEGFSTLPDEQIENLVGRGARQLVCQAIGNPTDDELGKVFRTFWNHYYAHLLDQTMLYPGVLNFLESFSHLSKAVVTNKPEIFSKKILEGLKIDHHFRWVIGGDTLPIQKPNPQVFDPILQDLGVPVQALMIGDSDVDIECGRAAGFLTCAVTYGFRPRQELELVRPDFIIDGFEELEQLPIFSEGFKQEAS
jgi:phosphoglycolate phosphatase